MEKGGTINLKQPWVIVLILAILAVVIFFYNTSEEITGNASVVIVEGSKVVFVEHFDVETGDITPENLDGVGGGHRVKGYGRQGVSDSASLLGTKNYLRYDMKDLQIYGKKISDVTRISFYFKPQFKIKDPAVIERIFLALGDVGNNYNSLEVSSVGGLVTLEINDRSGVRLSCPMVKYETLVRDDWYYVKVDMHDDFVTFSVEDYLTKNVLGWNTCKASEDGEVSFSDFEFDSFDKIWVGVDSKETRGASSTIDELKIYFE